MAARNQTIPRAAGSAAPLTCPECGNVNEVGAADLVEGHGIECRHCPAKLILHRGQSAAGESPFRWILAEPPAERAREEC